MSTYVYGYDDEAGERYIEVEIDYDFEPGYWDQIPGGYNYQRYWVSGEISINKVEVLFVEFYNPSGDVIAKLKREDFSDESKRVLDGEAFEWVQAEVENWDVLADDLAENAG